MSIWNKVFIGLIFLASIGFFILGARALMTHKYWREQALQLERELAQERDVELVLKEGFDSPEVIAREQELDKIGGDAAEGLKRAKEEMEGMREEAKMGLRRVNVALHEELVDRGRVWRDCPPDPAPETAKTGQLKVKVKFPSPHQIADKTVLWAFDQLPVDQGGRYLGQFTVDGVDNEGVVLKPTTRMDAAALAKLNQSATRNGAAWSLYEVMPRDNHRSLAGLSDDELKAKLPEETVDEYVSDGQSTTLEDVKQRGLAGKVFQVDESGQIVKTNGLETEVRAENVEGKYVRQLRDYEELFRQYHLRLTEGVDRRNTLVRNVLYIDPDRLPPGINPAGLKPPTVAALPDAKLQLQYRQEERDRLAEVERPKCFGQRDAVAAHLKAVQGKLAAIQAALAETIKTAQGMAGEIARIQREATRIIDERTQAMAQAPVGN